MIVKQLVVYPIKGLGGIEVTSAKALERGFEYDRRYMLVDKNGLFLSQRDIKEMAKFKCQINGNFLDINYLSEKLSLDLRQEDGLALNTTVWNHQVNAIEVSAIAHEWFSDLLKQDCKLVKMNKKTSRKKSLIKAPSTTQLSFADGYPYLVLGTASLDYLNTKLETPIPMNRFRANIILDSKYEHQEDEVDKFTLSGLKFRMIKPCARCQVITIDQNSGVAATKEPLTTLSEYRKRSNKIYFGMNAVCLEEGIVSIGDKLMKA